MPEKSVGQSLLENSYKLATPQDNAGYYDAFAPSYDSDFVARMGYQYPKAIAEAYHTLATPDDRPIADIGCGTGLVAAELGMPDAAVDGFDISAEMLRIAGEKSLYRSLHQVDLTGPLDAFAGLYGAVLSAGTFTHGHLGPAPLRALTQIAQPGGIFVIGVNQRHFAATDFQPVLDSMVAAGTISPVSLREVRIYATEGHEHSDDRALILHFRKS